MDIIKKEREQLRKHFKKTSGDLDVALKAKETSKAQILTLLRQLEDKSDRLFVIDETFKEQLFSGNFNDAEIQQEFDDMEFYRAEIIKFKSECEFRLAEGNRVDCENNSQSSYTEKSKRKFRLPKLELNKFDGNVKNWIGFWGQFKKIDQDEDIDSEDKFQYLLQSTVHGSPARELVESFPPSGENYRKALDQLKVRFARDEFLIEVYVRELLNIVLRVSKNKAGMSLSTLYNKLESQLRALESLGVTTEKYAAMLFPLVESALPSELLKICERHRNTKVIEKDKSGKTNSTSNNNLTMLLDFLRTEVESEERINLAKMSFGVEKEQPRINSKGKHLLQGEPELYSAASLYTANSKDPSRGKKPTSCLFCNNAHASQDCFNAQKLSLEERTAKVIEKKGCFSCLRTNHISKNCKAFVRCLICARKHFPIMCPDLKTKQVQTEENEKEKLENVLTCNYSNETFLQTVIVKLVNNNKQKIVRALLDSGSQRSYILSNCTKDLNCEPSGEENIIQGVFGGFQHSVSTHKTYNITIRDLNEDFECKLSVLGQNKICNSIPRLGDLTFIQYLKDKNIILSDVSINNPPQEIELLLGADIFGKLLTGNIKTMNNGLVAIETYIGWTIMGQYTSNTNNNRIFSGFADYSLADLWDLDVLGIKEPANITPKEIMEADTEKYFMETITRNDDGRYQVNLPWIIGHPELSSNIEIAEARLITTTKKLVNLGKFQEYTEVLAEWEALGIIEEVGCSETNQPIHFLPHHAIIKETSSTTKIRPVFDASAKDMNGNSLNKCLEKGPNLIELIPSLLIKFRLRRIGVTSDIEKAFLQISINPTDRDTLRFFWWKDHSQTVKKTFRHCRVVFGLKPSPFLLSATINYHLKNAPNHLKNTAEKLEKSFYVDNCITSVDNIEELNDFISQAKDLLLMGKFNLREWAYNSMNNSSEGFSKENILVLGLLWDIEKDLLFCDLSSLDLGNIPRTKRGLLSVAQKVFDPIGFTCPVTLIPKLLLQLSWTLKIGWDEELPSDIVNKFEKWMKQLHFLKLCKIPRSLNMLTRFTPENATIHVFCDASKVAFASCIFLRTETEGKVHLQLIQAKSRIAPKNITIPRLELLSTVIGVRLCQSIKKVEEMKLLKTFYWSDSMVALTWIKTKGSWNTSVGNRVKEITSCSNVNDWYHVPGDLNPADVASRGCTANVLMELKWWDGPEWLKDIPENWPYTEVIFSSDDIEKERRKTVSSNVSKIEQHFTTENFNYFSKYTKIIRMVAWMLRFKNNSQKKNQKITGELTFDELETGECHILKIIQKESFGSDRTKLANFTLTKDKNDILRMQTKLLLGSDTHDFKYPIILPYKHAIVQKLIEEQHLIHHHAGVQTLLGILRERYWILKGRKFVKDIVEKCVKCKRFKSKCVETPFAPLPRDRIEYAAAFEITGVDLAGPLHLKGGEKSWIVLFTCAVYRAVHLELVRSLSTDAFLLALRRFISRRGRVAVIYSDNGTNFTGAKNHMKQIDWSQVTSYSSVRKIKWHQNPPTAAWWGGWWERMVRVIKELLRRNLGKATLNYEELMTTLCDCEAIINARPITYISSDNDLKPLSPSMFISDIHSSETPDLDIIDRNNLLKRIRYLQKIRDGLRSRFRKEYLAELVHTGQRKTCSLRVGDIVLVSSDNVKRLNWPIGRILEIYPGKDAVPRVAKVKVNTGELIRPFQRLYPLEVTTDEDSQHFRHHKEKEEVIRNMMEDKIITEEQEHQEDKKEDRAKITRYGRVVKTPKRYGFE